MIEIDKLKFQYARSDFELDIPRLSIEQGQKVAVVGPSGCGKTTLLNLIAGISLPASGSVSVDRHPISNWSDTRRRDFRIRHIGLVFQQFELIDYLDVTANILLPFAINSSLTLNASTRERAQKSAIEMGLEGKLDRRSRQLSQGEQQRVAICRSLITIPKIILADEPTGNLDPKNKEIILDLIFEQAESNGQTLVVVTHDVSILGGFDQIIDFEKFRSDPARREATL